MKQIINMLKWNSLELLFSILGTEIIYSSLYRDVNLGYALILVLLNIIFYAFYSVVLKREEKGPRLYVPILIIVIIVFALVIKWNQLESDVSYSTWVFNGGHLLFANSVYEVATLVFVVFIFSSIYFYFSVKVVRNSILLLLVYMGIIIHKKCMYQRYSFLVYLFIITFIAIVFKGEVFSGVSTYDEVKTKKKHILTVGIIVVSLMATIAAIIPKPNNMPSVSTLNGVKRYFNSGINTIEAGGFNVENNKSRSVNESTEENSDNVIFEIRGSNPEYLVTHNYDDYYDNMWNAENSQLYLGKNISKSNLAMPIDFTMNNLDKSSLSSINSASNDDNFNKITYLDTTSYSVFQVSHPSNTTKCEIDNSSEDLLLNGYGMVINRNYSYFSPNIEYSFFYNSNSPQIGSKQDLLLKYFNEERYKDFLNEVCTEKVKKEKIEEMQDDLESYTSISGDISPEVKKLSKKISKDYDSNYFKAKAIENYLKSEDFEYSLNLGNQKNDENNDFVNDFILDTKKGYCVQYATAMTIMCRAAKVPARYVEGYLVREGDVFNNNYEVMESDAHAFVEVYIPGYGWKIFDPTPSSSEEEDIIIASNVENLGQNIGDYKELLMNNIVIIGVIIFIVVILCYTKKYIYFLSLIGNSNNKILEGIIFNSIYLLKQANIKPGEVETEMEFAIRVSNKINIDFCSDVKVYYKYKYAGIEVSKESLKRAFKINRQIYKFSKRNRKK